MKNQENGFVVRPNSGFDFLAPGAEFRDSGEDFVNLNTGEVISVAEYEEWRQSLNPDNKTKNSGPIDQSGNLLNAFEQAIHSLDSLAFLVGEPCLTEPDVNPDLEVGETGVTPLTFGSVENIVHPIFSVRPSWEGNAKFRDLVLQLSRLLTMLWKRLFDGFSFTNPSFVETLATTLSLFSDELEPLGFTPSMKKDIDQFRILAEARGQEIWAKSRQISALRKLLYKADSERVRYRKLYESSQTTIAKRNRLIKHLRRSTKTR